MKKLYIIIGLIFLGIAAVLGLFIYPTHYARRSFKEKLQKDIKTSFRALFPNNIWNTINNADKICFGNISIEGEDKFIFLEQKCFLKPKVISEIKNILTNPYNYTYYQDWFVEENKKIEKGIVILPIYNDFWAYTYSYPMFIRPSVFSFDKYIKFITKKKNITIIISKESAQIIIAQRGDETNNKMTFNTNKHLEYLVSEVYPSSKKRVVMDLEGDAMTQLLSLFN